MKRILSLVLSLCMVLTMMPGAAFAADPLAGYTAHNIESGGNITIAESGQYHIYGAGTVTGNTVSVSGSNVHAEIVLEDVNINTTDNNMSICAFSISSGARVTLKLKGNNELRSAIGRAGLEVDETSSLTITSYSGDGSTEGQLTAVAGNSGSVAGGAGIGAHGYISAGPEIYNSGSISIKGGTVTAYGCAGGAGIGGSAMGTAGTISISGGNVTAYGRDGSVAGTTAGAGIGGGFNGSASQIVISGGVIQASSAAKSGSAGIGSGYGADSGFGTITISGGTVKAAGGTQAADGGYDIGAGGGQIADSRSICITGGSIAGTLSTAATNGGGETVYLAELTLKNAGTVGISGIAGLTGSYNLTDMQTVDSKLSLWLPEGQCPASITAGGKTYERVLDSQTFCAHNWADGYCSICDTYKNQTEYGTLNLEKGPIEIIKKDDWTVTVISSQLLDGQKDYSVYEDIVIYGTGSQTGNTVTVKSGTPTVTLQNVSTTGTFSIEPSASVKLNLTGVNSLGRLGVPWEAAVTIGGDGELRISIHNLAAAIGGISGDEAGTITINSGTIHVVNNGPGAAIGGGNDNDGGTVYVHGGTITAINSSSEGGAGIGGGRSGDGGNVIITGGTILASTSGNGDAIGAGHHFGDAGDSGTLKNSNNEDVSLHVITLDGAGDGVELSGISVKGITYSYGINGVKTRDGGKLYLYLPSGAKVTELIRSYPAGGRDVYTSVDGNIFKVTQPHVCAAGTGNKCIICGGDMTQVAYPVTGIDGSVPAILVPGGGFTLPTKVLPSYATWRNLNWSIVSGAGETGAVIENGVLTVQKEGTIVLHAEVAHGISYEQAFTKEFTIAVSEAFDLREGNITITNDGNGMVTAAYADGAETHLEENTPIYISSDGQQTVNKITVKGNCTLVLKDCSSAVDGAALRIESGNVKLELIGNNTLVSNKDAVNISGNAALTIEGTGSLTANRGDSGAGISVDNAAKLIINSGVVTAVGGDHAAGIGGSYDQCGSITITGGTVTATGGNSAAGIGTGFVNQHHLNGPYNPIGFVTITGGTVTATGGSIGAAIGGGCYSPGSQVIIAGGSVKANGRIGKGYNASLLMSNGTLTNGSANGDDGISLVTVILDGIALGQEVSVASVDIPGAAYYNVTDVMTQDGGKLYFYLPSGCKPERITLTDGRVYVRTAFETYIAEHDCAYGEDGRCISCGLGQKPELDAEGNWLLRNPYEVIWFMDEVNRGKSSYNARMTADIDMSPFQSFVPMGTSSEPFRGTFDGGGYCLTVHLTGSETVAPFGYVNGGKIKNLMVDGTITASGKFAAGIVGQISDGSTVLEKCISSVDIVSSVNGDGTHGGLVGVLDSGTLSMKSCGFTGSISGEKTNSCGGMVGYSNGTADIYNSFVAGEFALASNDTRSNTFVRNTCTLSNCYYLHPLVSTPSGAEPKNTYQFASGEVTWLLNEGVTEETQKWYQNFGEDEHPSLTGKTVYATSPCRIYTNEAVGTLEHRYVDGFCTQCGSAAGNLNPAVQITSDNYLSYGVTEESIGSYAIATAEDLYWFAALVNGMITDEIAQKTDANAVLVNDITVNENLLDENGQIAERKQPLRIWFPIGYLLDLNGDGTDERTEYHGTFDGNGKTIRGLYSAEGYKNFGLIGANMGTVKNLLIEDSRFLGEKNVGIFVGWNDGGTIENCGSADNIAAGSGSGIGGVVGTNNGGHVTSCYSTGMVIGTGNCGSIFGSNQQNGTVENCYYINTGSGAGRTGNGAVTNISEKSAEAFRSGEVAYLLNGSKSDDELVWHQTIGTDAVPKFAGSTVYKVSCADVTCYSNENRNYETHNYIDGICSRCGEYQPYEISTLEQLMEFAALVNGGVKDANAVLMADIDLSESEWTTICETGLYYNGYGDDFGYSGTFDGNGHIIKNITVKSSAAMDASCGLFGTVSGTIKNLGIEGFTFVDGGKDIRAGAIVGQLITANGKVKNCYVKGANIDPREHVAGGIAGCVYDGAIENCYVVESTITGTSGRYGHIVGDSRGDGSETDRPGTVTNCYSDNGTLRSDRTGNVKNCAVKSNDAFASGEVTWLLNGASSDGIWKQTLTGAEAQPYPTFHGENVFYSEENGYINHIHHWTYQGADNTITATCGADGCTDADKTQTLVLQAAEGTQYDGTVHTPVTVTGTIEGVDTPEITYCCDGGCKNAGNHTASIVLDGAKAFIGFTIAPKPLTATMIHMESTLDYTGSVLHPELVMKDGDVILGESDVMISWNPSEIKNAGTYTASIQGQNNYSGTIHRELKVNKISPKAADFVFTATEDLVWNGSAKSAAVTPSSGIAGMGAVDVLYFDSQNQPVDAAVDAGSYTVKINVAEDGNYLAAEGVTDAAWTFTIEKAEPEFTAPAAMEELAYNGKEQNLVYSGSTVHGVFSYSLDGQNWSDSVPQGTAPGVYTVHYKVVGDSNHLNSAVSTIQVTIGLAAQQPLTIKGIPESVEYGDVFTVSTEGGNGEGAVTYAIDGTNAEINQNGEVRVTGTGTIQISAVKAADSSYNEASASAEFTAEQRTLTVTAAKIKNKSYDGTCTGEIEGITLANVIVNDFVTAEGTAVFESANAGTNIPVTVSGIALSGTDAAKYRLAADTFHASGTIVPANITVVPDGNQSKTYGTEDPSFTYTVTGDFVTGDVLSGALSRTEGETAGQYAYALGTLANPNYTIVLDTANKFEIKKAVPDYGTPAADIPSDCTYAGDVTITGTGGTVEGTFSVKNPAQTLVWGENEVTFVFTPVDLVNYETAEGTVKVTVTDTIKPNGEVTLGSSSWKEFVSNITFNLFFNKTVDVTVTAADALSGVAAVEYIESAEALDWEGVQAAVGWTAMGADRKVSVTAKDAAQFVYYIRITDKAGNVTILSTDGVVFDRRAPEITGVTDGGVYYTTQKFTVTETNQDTVTVNGMPVTEYSLAGNVDQTYVVVVTDKAGNSSTVTVTMKPISNLSQTIKDLNEDNVTGNDSETLAEVKAALAAVDQTNAADAEKQALADAQAKVDALQKVIEEEAAAVEDLKQEAEALNPDTITSDDRESVEDLISEITDKKADANLTENQKSELDEAIADAQEILDKIAKDQKTLEDALAAVSGITKENVKISDEKTLDDAAAALESLIDDTNYTEEEKAEIQTELDQIAELQKRIDNLKYAASLPDVQKPEIDTEEGASVELNPFGNTADITIEDGYELVDVLINGESVGKVTELTGLKTGDKVQVLVKKAAAAVEILLGEIDEISLVTRSRSAKLNGKKAIKIWWYDEDGADIDEIFDGYQVFRSVKRYSGFGKKPFFTTKRTEYWNNRDLKAGNTYYYKVRGYVTLDGKKYYSEWSRKAWRKF